MAELRLAAILVIVAVVGLTVAAVAYFDWRAGLLTAAVCCGMVGLAGLRRG